METDPDLIAVTFALPEESGDLRRALGRAHSVTRLGRAMLFGDFSGRKILVAHTGVGTAAAAENAASILQVHRPRMLISSGFAGGLDPRLAIADLLVATNFSAPDLLEKARALTSGERCFFGPLTTQAEPAECPAAKAALARETGALGVDMETAVIAGACGAEGVALLSVRAISDPAGEPLPVPFAEWFDLHRQRPRPFALVHFLALHPARVRPFARFVRGLKPARAAMTAFILRFLERERGPGL